MRSILTALVLAAIPGIASADCTCTCNGGQALPICTMAADIPPICQRLCPPVLSQSIATPSLGVALPNGNLNANTVLNGASTLDPTLAAAAAAAAAGLGGAGSSAARLGGTSLGGSAAGASGTGAGIGYR